MNKHRKSLYNNQETCQGTMVTRWQDKRCDQEITNKK